MDVELCGGATSAKLNDYAYIHCGIGKGASLGFGMIEEIRSKY